MTKRENKEKSAFSEPKPCPDDPEQPCGGREVEDLQVETPGVPKEEFEALEQERDMWRSRFEEAWDQFLRTRAELDNYRKRTERLFEDRLNRDKADFLRDLLEVMDNFDRFLEAANSSGQVQGDCAFESFLTGVTLICRQLADLMKKEGVELIPCPVGTQMDPTYHEAFQAQDGGGEHGTVVEELQKGYLYKGLLLRPTRVKVIR